MQSPMIQVVAYHAQQATLNIDKGADKLDKARRTKIRNLKVGMTAFFPIIESKINQFLFLLYFQRKTKLLFWVVVILVIIVLLLLFIE